MPGDLGPAAIGVNCTKPEHIEGLVSRIRATAPELPVVVSTVTATGAPALASGRVVLASGTAMLVAPFVLKGLGRFKASED